MAGTSAPRLSYRHQGVGGHCLRGPWLPWEAHPQGAPNGARVPCPDVPHCTSPTPGWGLGAALGRAAPWSTAAMGMSHGCHSLSFTNLHVLKPPVGIQHSPLAGPGSSLSLQVSEWMPHVSPVPHVLQTPVHPAPLCPKTLRASEQEPWTSPPGSCWGSTMGNTISPAAWRDLSGEEPLFWVYGLPKVHPVVLVRTGLLPFFPPHCVLLPLCKHRDIRQGIWWLVTVTSFTQPL